MIWNDLAILLPEIVLALYAMGALVGVAYTGRDRLAPTIVWATAALLVLVALWIAITGQGSHAAFSGMIQDDGFARFAKIIVLLSAAAVLVMGRGYMQAQGILRFEYPLLVVLAVVGMMVMVSAGDLIALYMGLELQSLALYVVAALRRDSVKSTEAGLKYFVLGALSSGVLLYGASLVYGITGTTLFSAILQVPQQGQAPIALLIGLAFVIAGLAFKVSAVPFHMWTPDVYEGAPTPVTALFASAPKVAALALFARVMHDAFGGIASDWQQIVALLSVLSMFLGAIAAIGQRNIKRLMAYSSIAHMGYALIGLAAGSAAGIEAMLIYIVVYVIMNLGMFAFILSLERDGQPATDIEALHGYALREPGPAAAAAVLLFSLAGVPPMLGFFAKFAVWRAALQADLAWLVVASALASAIGVFYYLRIVYYMFFGDEGEGAEARRSLVLYGMLMGAALAMLLGVVNLFGLEGAVRAAALALVR
ncbi:MAG: NADH-quinone oxidoreductase subunit NuoN [Rhodobacteraceae bacterium]|nr:NADH-quinone oxidoreductase subunit NuoN [Paracoccaceae bacterium]